MTGMGTRRNSLKKKGFRCIRIKVVEFA